MLSISTRFLSLLVVLLALSAVELELSQQHSQLVSAAPIQARNPNHSISSNSGSEHHRRGRATKPRVGIVVKPGSKVSLSGGAIKARSFQRDNQDGVRTLPLTKIRANIQGKEPLMVSTSGEAGGIGSRSVRGRDRTENNTIEGLSNLPFFLSHSLSFSYSNIISTEPTPSWLQLVNGLFQPKQTWMKL